MPILAGWLKRSQAQLGDEGKAALHGFVNIFEQFLKRLPLSGTTWDGRYFGPVATFFCLVDYKFDPHEFISAMEILPAAAEPEVQDCQ